MEKIGQGDLIFVTLLPSMKLSMKKAVSFGVVLILFLTLIPYLKKGEKKNDEPALAERPEYLQLCKEALFNEEVFQNFKRRPLYTLFQEFTTYEEGNDYLNVIYRDSPDLLNPILMKKFQSNDRLGNPATFLYKRIGLFSPTTLRYIKAVSDLRAHFGNLDGMKVIEIGGGYGGQCKILSDLFLFSSYTLVDFPESLELAKKYLERLNVANVQFLKADEIESQPCDLVISHYGFTQTNANLQKRYLKKIISNANRGYLVCNFFPKTFGMNALSKENLLKKLSEAGVSYEILPEEPLTGQNHFIIMWSK